MKGKTVVKINKFLDNKKSLFYILLIAFIIRLIWIVTVKTLPTSDFKLKLFKYASCYVDL